MALGPRLDLRQSQSLVMTPQLQQAIKLLALSNLEIETFIGEALDGNPLLKRSIRNRFPYLDPLNHVQVELLRRHRERGEDPRIRNGIHISINGIAAGLRNSG